MKMSMMKKRIFWLALAAFVGAVLLVKFPLLNAIADGKPYSVSLNSPVTFPVDI